MPNQKLRFNITEKGFDSARLVVTGFWIILENSVKTVFFNENSMKILFHIA